MSKPGIATQVEKWLEGRGRWLRSGGDNLVRYLSVMLGNGDQVDDLVELLAADEQPDWLYVERDGRRVTLIGLAEWRTDQAVEYDEVSDDAWGIVAAQYAEITRLQQLLGAANERGDGFEELCSQLTDPSAPTGVVAAIEESAESPVCDHGSLEREVSELRAKVTALDSVNANNQKVITALREGVRKNDRELKAARRSVNTATTQREEVTRAHFELVYMVLRSSDGDGEASDLARRQFMKFANLFRSVLEKPEVRQVREVHQLLSA